MSHSRFLGLGIAFLAGIFLASPVLGQASKDKDLLDQVKKRNEIAAQKLEADVKDALTEAQKLAGSDPAKAVDLLKKVQGQLEADQLLTPGRRDLLTRQIRDRIKTAQVEGDKAGDRTKTDNERFARTDIQKKEAERTAGETQQINRVLQYITALQKDGKTAEAKKAAEELLQRYPNALAGQAANSNSTVIDQVHALRNLKSEQANRYVGAMTDVSRSALPPIGDVEFPKDWAQKMKNRVDINKPVLSAKEKDILKALGTPIPVDFKETPFNDAIQYLSDKIGQPILLDKAALNEAQVTSETPVTLQIKGITTRTALRKILGDLGLAYVVKNETIQVVTEKQAKESMVVRTYFLGSLLAGGGLNDTGIRFNPWVDQQQAMQNVVNIVQMIQNSVDPSSWQSNGGSGTIMFHAPTMSLIVRQTAEVHAMLGGMMR